MPDLSGPKHTPSLYVMFILFDKKCPQKTSQIKHTVVTSSQR